MARLADLSLWDAFRRSLLVNQDREALAFGNTTLTYGQLGMAVGNAARRLADAGVVAGSPVVLLSDPAPAFPVHDLAIMALGAVKVPLNPQLAREEIAGIVERVRPSAMVVGSAQLSLADGLLDPERSIEAIVDTAAGGGVPACQPRDSSDPAVVYFTGGTTGHPKGIVHDQAGVLTNLWAHLLEAGIARDERLLLTTPLAHAAGLFTLAGLLRGAYVRIEPGFDADDVLDRFDEDAITWTFAVPTMIYRMLDAAAARGWSPSALRTIQYGGAPISAPRLREALDRFGPVLQQLYAQTECPNYAAVLRKEDHQVALERPGLLGSCGRPSLMCDITIRSPEGTELPDEEAGEICLRSSYVMGAYWDDPEAFTRRFFGDWLRTGDVGFRKDELIFLVDRKDDMIVSGGMNVYSLEVEKALVRLPGVSAAAVIGVPHDDWGEAVHAVVVADGADEQALKTHARATLAAYKRPKTYEFRDELPLTSYGKVDRKALRAPYWSGRSRSIN
jgi:fatty-acyl-CoA synthase/long-chain acyl-CoA synthetase